MKLSKILLSTVVLALPISANAGDTGKYYTSITGEYTFDASADGDVSATIGSAPVSVDYKDGYGALIAGGYYLTDNVRTEAEFGYHKLNGDTTSISIGGTTVNVDSSQFDQEALSFMGNVYYNFSLDSKVSPYIGGGIGLVHQQEKSLNAFGYQAMVGLDYKVSNNSTVSAGYRYLGTTNFEQKYDVAGFGTVTEKESLDAHSFDIGYRFKF